MSLNVKRASIINVIVNFILFLLKITIGIIFLSVSIISDAINSLSDIIAAILIYFTVKVNNKKADSKHQFGHTRAENIAGYTTGVLMIILSLSIMKLSFDKFMSREFVQYNYLMLFVVIITFFAKFCLYFYIKHILKTNKSFALKANLQDHLNDMIVIGGVFIAIIGLKMGIYWIDPLIGFIISIFVLKSGVCIAKENVTYLMGTSASKEVLNLIRSVVLQDSDVKKIEAIKTQYLGSKVQVELHVALDSSLSLKESHDIGEGIRKKVEDLDVINNCFVHIDDYEER